MLIQVSCSEFCRGWEGNESYIVEFDGTFLEYIRGEVKDCHGLETDEEVDELLNTPVTDFGWTKCGDERYDLEAEENTVTYQVFKPTQEFLEMIQRNVG